MNRQAKLLFIDASKDQADGNYDRALEKYQKCLELEPGNGDILYELSRTHRYLKHYSEAEELGKKALEVDQGQFWFNLNMAELKMEQGLYEDATKFYAVVVEQKNTATYVIPYAEALIFSNQNKEAINTYKNLVLAQGLSLELAHQIKQLYIQTDAAKEGISYFEEVNVKYKNQADYLLILAELYELNAQDQKADETYYKILEVDPTNGHAHLHFFEKNELEGNLSQALYHLSITVGDPNVLSDRKIKIIFGIFEQSEGNKALFISLDSMVNKLSTTHPNDAMVYSLSADFHLQKNEIEEARDDFQRCLSLDPSLHLIWEQLLKLDNDLNDLEAGNLHANQAIELFPTSPKLYYYQGEIYRKQGKYKQAIGLFELGKSYVVNDDVLKSNFYKSLGLCHYMSGNKREAFESFDKALNLFPDYYYVLNNYAYYLALEGVSLGKADQMIEKALSARPNNASYLDTKGYILFKQEKHEDARSYIEKAIKIKATGAIFEHYGDVLWHLKEKEAALEAWNKAQQMGGGSDKLAQKVKEKSYVD
jgi:tetratricopeptide (TPR) repeat protein